VSGERIDVTPEPTAAEAEAIRRALAALGLVEPGPPAGGQSPNGPRDGSATVSGERGQSPNGPRDASVAGSMPNLVPDP
jgi:hypothetical protein